MNLQSLPGSGDSTTPANENFETLDWASVFGKDQTTTSALIWGYLGGRWAGITITAGTVTLTASNTNYLVVNRTTGAVSVSTATTNWNTLATYARLYKITTNTTAVTGVEDHRAGPYGVFAGSTVGRHSIPINAAQMIPSAVGGCAALATIASAANQPDITSLDFDTTTEEYAQFSVAMPKSWNEGTITFKAVWSHAATVTNFGVVWELQAVAISDNEAIAVAYGTAISSTDTGGTTNNQYISPESAAITIAGTPAAEDVVYFRIGRKVADAGDTLAIDARLHKIVLYITTDADNDT